VDRAGQGTLLVLFGLAHVKELVVLEVIRDLVGIDLANFGFGGVQ
jgi:hypothetical protein